MQSLELFNLVIGGFIEVFKRVTKAFSFLFFGSFIAIFTAILHCSLFNEFNPFFAGVPPKDILITGAKDVVQLKYGIISFITLLVFIPGAVAVIRGMSNNLSNFALMIAGAIFTTLATRIAGLEISNSLWLLLAIFLLSTFQIMRQFTIMHTKRWETNLDHIAERNKRRKAADQKSHSEYIKQMEENG